MSNNTSSRLRDALLDNLVDQIENGPVVEIEGTGVRVSPSPALISAAVNFLKQFPPDGGLPASESTSKTLQGYAEKMAFAKR